MRLIVVAIRDRAANVFGVPSFVPSLGSAVRSFSDEVNRPGENNVLNRHPEDFDLYELGVYDDNSGTFETLTPRQVAVGKDLVSQRA